MSAKMGRPKSDNPKGTQISVRLTDEELKRLDENAQYYEETRAQSLRRGIEEVRKGIKK